MANESRTYRKSPDVVLRRVAGEALLIPIRRRLTDLDRIFTINETGEAVWELLNGRRTLEDIAMELAARFDVEPARARADVEELLDQLHAAALVEPAQ